MGTSGFREEDGGVDIRGTLRERRERVAVTRSDGRVGCSADRRNGWADKAAGATKAYGMAAVMMRFGRWGGSDGAEDGGRRTEDGREGELWRDSGSDEGTEDDGGGVRLSAGLNGDKASG